MTAMDTTGEKPDREKEFFMTWLQLMERQKEGAELNWKLHSLLTETGDSTTVVTSAQKQSTSVIANDQKITELVAQINAYFFQDIVPALKRAKQVDPSPVPPQDALDQYLRHGDETSTSSQDFVDNMSGWEVSPRAPGCPCGQVANGDTNKSSGQDASNNVNKTRGRKKKKRGISCILLGAENGDDTEDNLSSDDDIPSDKFHDMLIANGLRLTSMQAPGYAASAPRPGASQASAPAAGVSRSPARTKSKKRSRTVPPPIVTDLPNRQRSASTTSTPRTLSQSPERPGTDDRISKNKAAKLLAEQVLGSRPAGHNKEFQIRWKGVPVPLWITRRRAPDQAKVLIDQYTHDIRAQQEAVAVNHARGLQSGGKKQAAVKHATNFQKKQATSGTSARWAAKGEPKFYTVDHIVSHKMHYNKKMYLVRWENYDESENTWEDAANLRADVPDIVAEYEQKIERDLAMQSAFSELTRDAPVESRVEERVTGDTEEAKGTTDKADEGGAARVGTTQPEAAEKEPVEGENVVTQQQQAGDEKDGESSDDGYQFDLEEAELQEFSDDEFTDSLHI